MRLVRRLRMEVRNFKERYWRFSLFVLILGLGAAIFIELTPFSEDCSAQRRSMCCFAGR